ncbi:hypothetical protein O2U01_05200 [Ligilactobacillus salivarius]|nr:hypothetical protein [Ligilactobacillus salivarius]WHS08947.1 hypothetical protein O2U05_02995 [Ligilactobacillus salivarius]WHS21276.1 hypothetical protein O2U01_05200 [Ligilactobacillus salivarius]WHS23379.1 hypothetical protein O2U08_05190 [Ligilactobacillus salivarius]
MLSNVSMIHLLLKFMLENQAAVSFYNKQGLKIVRKQSDEMESKEYLMQWGK